MECPRVFDRHPVNSPQSIARALIAEWFPFSPNQEKIIINRHRGLVFDMYLDRREVLLSGTMSVREEGEEKFPEPKYQSLTGKLDFVVADIFNRRLIFELTDGRFAEVRNSEDLQTLLVTVSGPSDTSKLAA